MEINNKQIFITEKHHHCLIPWAEYRQIHQSAPFLFSLDHHTDINEPFRRFAFDHSKIKYDEVKAKNELNKMDFNNIDSINSAIKILRNDEHIQTAIEKDIISKASIISYSNVSDSPTSFEEEKYTKEKFSSFENINTDIVKPSRPFTYPKSNIYIPENVCAIGCKRNTHNDDCLIPHFNQCIESIFIDDKLNIMEQMDSRLIANGNMKDKYILDIDLDYFHTTQSINPQNPETFYKLIREAELITIARETEFINEWSEIYEYDPDLTVEYLEKQLIKHIELATK